MKTDKALRFFANTSVEDKITSKEPDLSVVTHWLHRVFEKGGTVRLETISDPSFGDVTRLSIRANPKKYMLIATICCVDGDEVVRWWNADGSPEHGNEEILGDLWDARSVLGDISEAIRVFSEFLDSGNLSKETLKSTH